MRLTGKDGELRIYDNTGQYYTVIFSNMDFSGASGRAKPEEILDLDRKKMSSNANYHQGSRYNIMEPISISFSCILDDTINASQVINALLCANPNTTNWTIPGSSTKGTTKNDGSNYNPSFYTTKTIISPISE